MDIDPLHHEDSKEARFEKAKEEFKSLHLRLPTLEEESEIWELIYSTHVFGGKKEDQ